MPVVDAPVSVERITLHLPPRYRSRLGPGDGAVVKTFDRGGEVAYGLWDARTVARADRVFSEAVDAWNGNEFERAQDGLDELYAIGASGANVAGLQANVELVRPRERAPTAAQTGTAYDFDGDAIVDELDVAFEDEPSSPMASAPPSSALARRIRARARARSSGKKANFEGRKRKAKKLKDEGQYEAAAEEYRQAIEESQELLRLEDEESVEYEFEADALEAELQEVEARTGTAEDAEASEDVREAVEDVVDEAGEKDLVGGMVGLWRVIGREVAVEDGERGDVGEAAATVNAEPSAPWGDGPLVVVPAVGIVVRYQHLLLEAGEQRAVRVDARRAFGR